MLIKKVTVLLLMNSDQSEKNFYLKLNNQMGAKSKVNAGEVDLGPNSFMEVTILHEEGEFIYFFKSDYRNCNKNAFNQIILERFLLRNRLK